MIDEVLDRQLSRELRNSADMIRMVVSNQEVVNLFDAGLGGSGGDAIGVAVVEIRPSLCR